MKIHVDETELKFFIQNEVMKQLRNSQMASKGYVLSEIQDRFRRHSRGADHNQDQEAKRFVVDQVLQDGRGRDKRLGTLEKQVKKLFAEIDTINTSVRILIDYTPKPEEPDLVTVVRNQLGAIYTQLTEIEAWVDKIEEED